MQTQTIEEHVDLTGKTAIVTGGASGIGQAIAVALADCGAAVMIADRDLNAAYETVDIIRSRGGVAQGMDVGLWGERDAEVVADATMQYFGSLDILVNCPPEFSFSPRLPETRQLWRQTLRQQVSGISHYSHAAGEEMIEGGRGGRIINLASIDMVRPPARLGKPDSPEESVAVLSKKLAMEFGPHGITVNAIASGLVKRPGSEMQEAGLFTAAGGSRDEMTRPMPEQAPDGQVGGAEEIATVVLFLVSPAGKDVTGNLVVVG